MTQRIDRRRALATTFGAVAATAATTATLGTALFSPSAHAQAAYSSKPVRFIVPYAVGNAGDIGARFIGDELSRALGQPFVIDNKPGAGGNVGTSLAAQATGDGYTLLMGSNATHAANEFLYAQPGYDAQADFEPVAFLGILPLVYATQPQSSVNDIQGLIAAVMTPPRSACGASPSGGATRGPAKPVPRWPRHVCTTGCIVRTPRSRGGPAAARATSEPASTAVKPARSDRPATHELAPRPAHRETPQQAVASPRRQARDQPTETRSWKNES